MKKKLSIILALLLSASMAACSSSKETTKKKKDSAKKTKAEATEDDEDDEDETTKKKKETEEEPGETTDDEEFREKNFIPDIHFTITDVNGEQIDETIFMDHDVTMINFWEPWCGPCVNEMPELQKLYENYKDKGLLVIGVFSATDQMEDVNDVLSSAGTTYPVCIYDSVFDQYQTGYVPTTIFFDRAGHIISVSNGYGDGVIVGSNSYDDWAALVDGMLG
ncbi:MAG: TlpA family protein disulfide reductase [Clostridiales bacterium]|nr:TlpA family protein disulfide reductase [Clostridiales bacterium]